MILAIRVVMLAVYHILGLTWLEGLTVLVELIRGQSVVITIVIYPTLSERQDSRDLACRWWLRRGNQGRGQWLRKLAHSLII